MRTRTSTRTNEQRKAETGKRGVAGEGRRRQGLSSHSTRHSANPPFTHARGTTRCHTTQHTPHTTHCTLHIAQHTTHHAPHLDLDWAPPPSPPVQLGFFNPSATPFRRQIKGPEGRNTDGTILKIPLLAILHDIIPSTSSAAISWSHIILSTPTDGFLITACVIP